MDDHNLIYIERETSQEFKVKRITGSTYSLLHPDGITIEKIPLTQLRKRFKSDVRNLRMRKELISKCKTIFHYE